MSFELPRSLSPSKVSTFRDCALAFRFSAIDRLAEPSTPATAKGTLVHRALERLFWNHQAGTRSAEAAHLELAAAWEELREDPDFADLNMSEAESDDFVSDAASLVDGYLRLEDPDRVDMIGVELTLEANLGGLCLRGIIDRLDRTEDGELVVVDYKTGRVPTEQREHSSLAGVQFYA